MRGAVSAGAATRVSLAVRDREFNTRARNANPPISARLVLHARLARSAIRVANRRRRLPASRLARHGPAGRRRAARRAGQDRTTVRDSRRPRRSDPAHNPIAARLAAILLTLGFRRRALYACRHVSLRPRCSARSTALSDEARMNIHGTPDGERRTRGAGKRRAREPRAWRIDPDR